MRDKLFDNLAEVDKSLRRSYIVQVILCLLFFYFTYNSITVANQKEDVERDISDLRDTIEEFNSVNTFIKELGNPSRDRYNNYVLALESLADKLKALADKAENSKKKWDQLRFASSLKKNAEIIKKSLAVSKDKYNTAEDNSKLSITEIITLMESLKPVQLREGIEQFIKKDLEIKEDSAAILDKNDKAREFPELIAEKLDCLESPCKSLSGINDRIAVLQRVKKLEGLKKDNIRIKKIEDHKKILEEKSQNLTDPKFGSIEIPFTGQPLEIDLAFRIGPIAILLIQIFISAYFRHRYELISLLNTTFDPAKSEDRKMKARIHLFLWPWILNYPYFRSETFRLEKQRGDFITKSLLAIVRFLPILTIGFIAIRPTFRYSGGSSGIGLAFVFWTSINIILLFLTMRQVLYAGRLDKKVSESFGWQAIVSEKIVVEKQESRLRRETIFVLMTFGALLLNFRYPISPYLEFNFEVIPPLLIMFAGLRFSKVRTYILTWIVVGCWTIISLSFIMSGELDFEDYFQWGLWFGPMNVPHSSFTDLVHLVLLSYFTVLLRQKLQNSLAEADTSWAQLSLPALQSSRPVFRKFLRCSVAIIAIIASNVMFSYSPRGMALVTCLVCACWLGPKPGALAGGIAILLSWMLSPIIELTPMIRLDYRQLGQVISFAIVGYIAGKTWLLMKQSEILNKFGAKLSFLPKKVIVDKRVPFSFLLILLVFSSTLSVGFKGFDVSLSFLFLPLPTVMVILLGIFYGSRKAAWSAGITLILSTIVTSIAMYFKVGNFFELYLGEGSYLIFRLTRWSMPSIMIWILTAYLAGKFDLISSRQNLFRFALAVFVAFQLPTLIKYGDILSTLTFRGSIAWLDMALITSLVQLLEPWLIVLLVGFFTRQPARYKSANTANEE
jgi:hypothetical protein